MSGFFTSLVQRVLQPGTAIEPLLPGRFAEGRGLATVGLHPRGNEVEPEDIEVERESPRAPPAARRMVGRHRGRSELEERPVAPDDSGDVEALAPLPVRAALHAPPIAAPEAARELPSAGSEPIPRAVSSGAAVGASHFEPAPGVSTAPDELSAVPWLVNEPRLIERSAAVLSPRPEPASREPGSSSRAGISSPQSPANVGTSRRVEVSPEGTPAASVAAGKVGIAPAEQGSTLRAQQAAASPLLPHAVPEDPERAERNRLFDAPEVAPEGGLELAPLVPTQALAHALRSDPGIARAERAAGARDLQQGAEPSAPSPTVRVNVGRIEVRAPSAGRAPRPAPPGFVSLSEYMKRGSG